MSADGAAGFHVGGFFLQGLAFVDRIFPFTEGDLHFDEAVFEIDLERDESKAFFVDAAFEAQNLLFVEEQSAGAGGDMVEDVAVVVGLHGHLVQFGLAVLHLHVSFVDPDMALPDRFDLGAVQLNAGFELVQHMVIPKGLAVGGHYAGVAAGFFLFFRTHGSC